jgi:hypothetical protein
MFGSVFTVVRTLPRRDPVGHAAGRSRAHALRVFDADQRTVVRAAASEVLTDPASCGTGATRYVDLSTLEDLARDGDTRALMRW